MRLSEVLVARRVVEVPVVLEAIGRQTRAGGALGENLLEMGAISAEDLECVQSEVPSAPRTIAETGVGSSQLLSLLLKLMLVEARETVSDLAKAIRLPRQIVSSLITEAGHRKLVQSLGSGSLATNSELRYALSQEGHRVASEALENCHYVGPAPVTLDAFRAQIEKQHISNEHFCVEDLRRAFDGMVVPEHYVRKLLPAVNSGRTMLLFGAPGNGKTLTARRIGALFQQRICIPYAVDVGGQIMKVFDPMLHRVAMCEQERSTIIDARLDVDEFDDRWKICHRPFIAAGGELTLDMLDLRYDKNAKFYAAPLHVKALNGVFFIDDFGRQRMDPKALLNRWIVPMENRIDYLRLHTGESFSLPFDELLLFSTNIDPQDITDPALLRRIPYKVNFYAPDREEYRELFTREAAFQGLVLSDEVFEFTIEALGEFGLAYFQPKFICDQVAEICRSFSIEPRLTRDLVLESLSNLYVQIEKRRG